MGKTTKKKETAPKKRSTAKPVADPDQPESSTEPVETDLAATASTAKPAKRASAKRSSAKRPARKASAEPDVREQNREAALTAAQYALDKKATQVRLLDLTGITSMTDFFVIATGDSDRQVKAIAENVIAEMRDTHGVSPWRSEGWDALQWVLIDFVDFVVHVFQTEARQYYNLERLWADAPALDVEDKAATKTKPASRRKKAEPIELAPESDDENSEEHSKETKSRVRVISDFKDVRS